MKDNLTENIIYNFSRLEEKMKANRKSYSPKRKKNFNKKFYFNGLTPFLFFLCLILMLPVIAQAASVTMTWDRNQEPDIAGCRIYCGMTFIITYITQLIHYPLFWVFMVLFCVARGIKPILFNMQKIRGKFHEHYRLDLRKTQSANRIDRREKCATPPAKFVSKCKYDIAFKVFLFSCFVSFIMYPKFWTDD